MVGSKPSAHSCAAVRATPASPSGTLWRARGRQFGRPYQGLHFRPPGTPATAGPVRAPGPCTPLPALPPAGLAPAGLVPVRPPARRASAKLGRVAALAFPVAAVTVTGMPTAWSAPLGARLSGQPPAAAPAGHRGLAEPVTGPRPRPVGGTVPPGLFQPAPLPIGGPPRLAGLVRPLRPAAGPQATARPTARLVHPVDAPVSAPGAVATFGDARFAGAPGPVGRDLVGISMSSGGGYWAATAGGSVLTYGAAHDYGSPGRRRGAPVTSISATPAGRGYWVATRAGGVFSFGDAHFFGSLGRAGVRSPVVSIASTPDGGGYWLATASGGTYTFGDAHYFGSLGDRRVPGHVVGLAPTPDGRGYWLATSRGDVYSFGDARFFGSLGHQEVKVTSIAASPRAQGYWLLTAHGTMHAFGAAAMLGSPVVSGRADARTLAATRDGMGYVVATASPGAQARPVAGAPGHARSVVAAAAAPAATYLGTFMVTCYDLSGITASGSYVGPESVAVDPGVVPLGTELYIDGVGLRTADDTGGAIIGHHLDIWEPTYSDCINWGVQYRAVYRVGG